MSGQVWQGVAMVLLELVLVSEIVLKTITHGAHGGLYRRAAMVSPAA